MLKKIKEKDLDKVFSKWIRQRDNWTCQYCQRKFNPPTNELHNSHFFTRTARSTRWEEANCDSMCRACHFFLETRKNAEYYVWKANQLGEQKFEELRQQYVTLKQWTDKEKAELLKKYS